MNFSIRREKSWNKRRLVVILFFFFFVKLLDVQTSGFDRWFEKNNRNKRVEEMLIKFFVRIINESILRLVIVFEIVLISLF